MKITGIIWLEEIVDKLAQKHQVAQKEVIEILAGRSHFRFVKTV